MAQAQRIEAQPGLVVGTVETIDGVAYVVTQSGIERLAGDRKERRARIAELRKSGFA